VPDDQDNRDNLDDPEAASRRSGGRELRGTYRGVEWRAVTGREHATLTIGGRTIHVTPDDVGSFVSHAIVGRWRDLEEMAMALLRYHPDYSPLARRPGNEV
jgi:hypothetical protein